MGSERVGHNWAHTYTHTHTHILFMSGIVYWTLSVNDYIVQEKYDRIYGCQKKQNLYRIKLFSRNTWASVDRRWRQTPICIPNTDLSWRRKSKKAGKKFVTCKSIQFSSVQSFSHVWLFGTPWTAACQVSLANTDSLSLLKILLGKSVMPSNHLILCRHPSPAFILSQHQSRF